MLGINPNVFFKKNIMNKYDFYLSKTLTTKNLKDLFEIQIKNDLLRFETRLISIDDKLTSIHFDHKLGIAFEDYSLFCKHQNANSGPVNA